MPKLEWKNGTYKFEHVAQVKNIEFVISELSFFSAKRYTYRIHEHDFGVKFPDFEMREMFKTLEECKKHCQEIPKLLCEIDDIVKDAYLNKLRKNKNHGNV